MAKKTGNNRGVGMHANVPLASDWSLAESSTSPEGNRIQSTQRAGVMW